MIGPVHPTCGSPSVDTELRLLLEVVVVVVEST